MPRDQNSGWPLAARRPYETLEEIAQENAEIFKHNGGEQFAAVPCLNDSDPGMDVIRKLVLRELQGWL